MIKTVFEGSRKLREQGILKLLGLKIIFFSLTLESSHRRNIAIGNTTLVLDMKDTAGEVSSVLHDICSNSTNRSYSRIKYELIFFLSILYHFS